MSFSDLMSSARGPGVIGMLLALVVLIGFGVLFVFAFDEGAQGGQSIESFIAQQAKEIDSIKTGIERGEKELAKLPARQAAEKALTATKREIQFQAAKIDSLKKGVISANEDITEKNQQFDNYKNEYRTHIRGKAKGETLEKLTTLDGTVYESVKIREITPIGIQIAHSGGQKRIAYESLPREMQDLYQFDPKQKTEALAAENADHARHESDVSAAEAAANEQAMAQKQKDAELAREKAKQNLVRVKARIEVLKDEIKRLEEAIPRESLKSISNAPQMRQQLDAKKRSMSALIAEAAKLEATL